MTGQGLGRRRKKRGRRKRERNHALSNMVEMSDLIIHKRSKRLRSLVWNDFKKIKKNGKDLAMCKNCCREFVGKASSGTTHLKKHLERCTKKPAVDAGHEVLAVSYKIKNEAPVEVPFEVPAETPEAPKFLSNVKFDQDQSQFDLTRMFILHGYPFSLVEHAGFKMFVNNLQPQFKMVSPSTVKADCISIFEQEKEKLFGVLDKHLGRISLTASIWKSYQNVSYLCLTAQYIDEAWALRKKILNFVMIESLHSGGLSEVIMTRLMDWNIYHKLFSMTMVKANFDRYWKVCSMILAVAVILDPRFKMKLVEYYYHQIYGNDATDQVKEVYDVITGLYNEYAGHSTYLRYQEYSGRVESSHGTEFTGSLLHTGGPGDSLRGYDEFVSATSQNQKPKSDLELYLEECVSPRTHEFNILSWWRVSAPRYPVLSRLARDILGIPISTVSFEATFSSRGKVLDAYKSSLDPQTVQALVCAEDWLWDQFVGSGLSVGQI